MTSQEKLPAEPLIIIEANRKSASIRDLWIYRDLFSVLTARDIKVRYKQTALGAIWAIAQPLLTMLIFTIFFGKAANFGANEISYPLFAFAGLVPWIFFSNAVTNSGNSLIGSANLITKVYFPRMIIPLSAAASGLADLAVSCTLLLLLMIYYAADFSIKMLTLPLIAGLIFLFAAAAGMCASALNVKYRDVRYALPLLIQLGLFASGIITPIPEKWRFVELFNPMAAFIKAFRAACFNQPFDWISLSAAIFMTFGLLFFAAHYFHRTERRFADVI